MMDPEDEAAQRDPGNQQQANVGQREHDEVVAQLAVVTKERDEWRDGCVQRAAALRDADAQLAAVEKERDATEARYGLLHTQLTGAGRLSAWNQWCEATDQRDRLAAALRVLLKELDPMSMAMDTVAAYGEAEKLLAELDAHGGKA